MKLLPAGAERGTTTSEFTGNVVEWCETHGCSEGLVLDSGARLLCNSVQGRGQRVNRRAMALGQLCAAGEGLTLYGDALLLTAKEWQQFQVSND